MMKKTIKKLFPVLIAAIVIFSYLSNWTGEQDSAIEDPAGSTAAVLQEAEEISEFPSQELEEAEESAGSDQSEAEVSAEISVAEADAQNEEPTAVPVDSDDVAEAQIDEDGIYTSKEDVALYIHTYGKLPSNFITKKEAEAAGWPGGNLEPYCPGKCIGGSYFGNYEGLLPDKKGRTWTECDINTLGAKSRGAERIIFSNDGLVYYTGDHYESFELLYGEP